MPKKTLFLIIGLVIVTIILFVIALQTGQKETVKLTQQSPVASPTPTPVAHTTLTLSPNPVEVAPGKQGAIDVMIDTSDNKVTAVQLELVYDPLAVTNVKLTPGPLFTLPVVLINKNDVKTGRITYAFGIQPSQKTVNGTGSVATITFTAIGLANTKTYFTVLPTTLVTAQGMTESVLKNSSGTTINIVSGINTVTSSTSAK